MKRLKEWFARLFDNRPGEIAPPANRQERRVRASMARKQAKRRKR